MSSFLNDSLQFEPGDMFNKSISVKNRIYLMYVIQDDVDGLTVYALNDESNQWMHISNAEILFIAIISSNTTSSQCYVDYFYGGVPNVNGAAI
jgi:hypothetical protein